MVAMGNLPIPHLLPTPTCSLPHLYASNAEIQSFDATPLFIYLYICLFLIWLVYILKDI